MPRDRGLGEVLPGEAGRFFIEWWHGSPLRPAEHNARAMLMGRYYNPMMHDYRVRFETMLMDPKAKDAPLDADTLEPYVGSRKKWRDEFQLENGLTETQMTFTAQASYHGNIAWPTKGLIA